MKALNKLEMDDDVTIKQQKVLSKLRQHANFGWMIMNKRHSYTDEQPNHKRIFIDGLIIVVKKPYIRLAREIFAMIQVQYSNCRGGGRQILPTGNRDVHGYKGYEAMMIRNNKFHNSTDCITINGHHPDHQNLEVSFGQYPSQKVYKHLMEIDGVYDVVETNQSLELAKYFIIVERNKRRQDELIIHEIMKALSLQITDIRDNDAGKHFNQYPSLRLRLSQGGYTMEAVELDKEIYDSATLSKSFSRTPYFEMGIQLGTDDLVDELPTIPSPANAWKSQQPANRLAILGNPQQSNDDRSLTSMNDQLLANTFASF